MERYLVKRPREDEERIQGLRLIPNFITRAEEQQLIDGIDKSVWNLSLKRRTQHYGFMYNYTNKDIGQEALPIPEWCTFLIDRLLEQKILAMRPDQVIVNEYLPGQGIHPHIDSTDAFMDGIVSVSLASDIMMDFSSPHEQKHVILTRCSMLSLHGAARYDWKHGIAARKTDNGVKRQRRLSLTFRKVKPL